MHQNKKEECSKFQKSFNKGGKKMANLTELTVHELQEKLASGELTVSEITKAY